MPAPQMAPQYFGPVSATDQRVRYVDLSARFPSGITPTGTPTAKVLSSANDGNPLALVTAAWDLGPRNVNVAPYGRPYLSPGPRVVLTITGGTKGNTYTILVSFTDSTGQNVTLPVHQFVQWDANG
jgi:hypothetical protein